MKMRFLRDGEGKKDRRYMIAEDGSYIRDKETGKKLDEKSGDIYVYQGYRVINLKINRRHYTYMKICRLQWLTWKGIIPKRYHIHHKEFDKDRRINVKLKLNDGINNLDCVTNSKHRIIHTLGEKNPFYKKHHTEEWKRNHSKAVSGKNNYMYKKHHSKEALEKISEAVSGENHPLVKISDKEVEEIRCLRYIENWTYQSIADEVGTSISNVNHIVNGHSRNKDPLTNKILTKQELIQQTLKEN
jgi:hypothetical protein